MRGEALFRFIRRAGLPVVLVLLWHGVYVANWANPLFVPAPHAVFKALITVIRTGELFHHALDTLLRMLAGFGIATAIGIPIGLILGRFRRAYVFSEFMIDFTRSIPATAVFPLFMLVFGVGSQSKIAIIAFSCFFVILINSIYGVWNAPRTRILMGRTFRASQLQIFTKIILFDALPQIFAGLRNAVSIAFILAIVTEMFIGTNSGLGFLIFNAKISYDTPKMYAVIIILGVLGYSVNKCLLLIENRSIHWSRT